MGDGELVRQVLAGKVAAYEPLARQWAPRVMAVCHARVGRADAAEDLAQETLLRGLRALRTLSDPEKFGPWLCGIAVRTCLDWLKASARTEVSMSALPDGTIVATPVGQSVTGQTERRDEIRRLMLEVEKLPPAYRQVLMQYYYQDCTYKQLAEQLGVSVATVNMRLTKARQMLRQRLSAEPGQVASQETPDAV
jgi:RNA polymerase sigma factor (sigma-70 family)